MGTQDEMADDKAKSTVLPLSKFGLMQITRERVRPQMNIATKEVCPTCNGTVVKEYLGTTQRRTFFCPRCQPLHALGAG